MELDKNSILSVVLISIIGLGVYYYLPLLKKKIDRDYGNITPKDYHLDEAKENIKFLKKDLHMD
jgi:hypothetical protein